MALPPLEHNYIGLSESPDEASATAALDLRHTELRLGLPGSELEEWVDGAELRLTLGLDKGGFSLSGKGENAGGRHFRPAKAAKDAGGAGAEKVVHSANAQVVGWPPIRSYRKNAMAANPTNNKEDETKQGVECLFIKVSMDGAPYLRKVDLKTHSNYKDLSLALEKMFTCFTIRQYGSHGKTDREVLTDERAMDLLQGSGYVLTYEDKDGDWMLVGDVPWQMFTDSCRRLRIMKGSAAIGIGACRSNTCKLAQRN